jgi:hypothetical protein
MENLIYKVEQKWLRILFSFCRDIFRDSFLPSHNELHHYRVWITARELISELSKQDFVFFETEIEKLIIAIFFHDVGMVKNLDKKHGKISRDICKNFFKRNPEKKFTGLNEVYEAIEKHDDKEYKKSIHLHKDPKNLFSILCASDDLDAFGTIGIYRYAEIYLMRNIKMNELPYRVINNINHRYHFFQKNYGFLTSFSEKQKARYLTIKTFYEALQKQLTDKPCTSSLKYGHHGVITNIIQFILERKLSPEVVTELIIKSAEDLFIIEFFKQFDKEMMSIHPRNNHMLQNFF